jgi:hypothetical protein
MSNELLTCPRFIRARGASPSEGADLRAGMLFIAMSLRVRTAAMSCFSPSMSKATPPLSFCSRPNPGHVNFPPPPQLTLPSQHVVHRLLFC